MSKNKDSQAKNTSTKRQRSYWQQQELRQRIIGFIGVAVVAVVAIVIASGWFFKQYLPIDRHMRTTVVEVCGQKYNMAYFIDMLTYVTDTANMQNPQLSVDEAEQQLERSAIINAAAAKLGFSVSDGDVTQYLKEINEIYGYYYGITLPDNAAVRDVLRAQLLAQRLKDDYFGPDTPITAEYREVMAMFLDSESKADEIRARLVLGEDFGALAAEYSLESKTKEAKGALGSHPKGVFDYLLSTKGIDEVFFSQTLNSWGLYYDDDFSKMGGYWLVKITERNDDDGLVRVSAMLLSSEDEAKAVKARLDNGESFTTLAELYSQCWDDEDKDDLGWMDPYTYTAYMDYIADENSPVGKVSDPIKDASHSTTGGYWLFKVTDSKTEDVSAEDRNNLILKAYNEWLNEQIADTQAYPVVNHMDETMRNFAISRVGK